MYKDPSPVEGPTHQMSDKAMISAMLSTANIFLLFILVAGLFSCASEFDLPAADVSFVCIEPGTMPKIVLISLLLSTIGVITGRSARSEIEKSNGMLDGSKAAQAGMVMGRLGLIVIGLSLVAFVCLILYGLGSI